MPSFFRDLLNLKNQIPVSTTYTYNIDPRFDDVDTSLINFDPIITNNRMSAQEFEVIIQNIRTRCEQELSVIRALLFLRMILSSFIIILLFFYLVGSFNASYIFPIVCLVIYAVVILVYRYLRMKYFMICKGKIDGFLNELNAIKYHPRRLHWSMKITDFAEYLELDLEYKGYVLVLPETRKKAKSCPSRKELPMYEIAKPLVGSNAC